MSISQAGRQFASELGPEALCVIYDPQTGQIIHIHEFINLRREQLASKEELEKLALSAINPSVDSSRLKILHVDPKSIQRGAKVVYRVDLKSQSLVTLPEEQVRKAQNAGKRRRDLLLPLFTGLLAGIAGVLVTYFLLR